MPHFTQAEVDAIEARVAAGKNRQQALHETVLSRKSHLVYPGDDRESVLHSKILEICKQRGWIACHGVMHRASGRTPGEPDFTIWADGGRVFLVECKTAQGKLTTEQLGFRHMLERNGHHGKYYVVRSIGEFLELVK